MPLLLLTTYPTCDAWSQPSCRRRHKIRKIAIQADYYFDLRVLDENETALPVVGRASYCLADERLLVRCYALEAVSDGEVPLD